MTVAILNTTALPPPSTDPAIDPIEFEDGARIRHDSDSGQTDVHSPGDLNLTGGGDIWLDAAHVHVHEDR